jgi:hypothetical protein
MILRIEQLPLPPDPIEAGGPFAKREHSLYKSLINSNHILYLEGPLLEISALSPPTEEATPMHNTSLLAHELLCLHLKSFYGVQPCSPSPEAPTVPALTGKAGKKFRATRSLRRGTRRF